MNMHIPTKRYYLIKIILIRNNLGYYKNRLYIIEIIFMQCSKKLTGSFIKIPLIVGKFYDYIRPTAE